MSDEQPPALTYPGGFDAVVARMDARREPLSFAKGEALPALNCNLAALKSKRITQPEKTPKAKDQSGNTRKWLELVREFEDQPALLHLHALLIAHLRKSDQPSHTMALFTRIWAEEAEFLMDHLDPRWLVSAITTFGDHGTTEVQRRVGHSMTVLFGTMKLYESERLYSGFRPEQEFKLKRLVSSQLPLNMDRYALVSGGLDINMLGRLWVDAAEDAVLKPLAHRLLNMLNADAGTVFRRFSTLRGRKLRQKDRAPDPSADPVPAKPQPNDWSVVSTIKTDAPTALAFANHHLALGAEQITLYLDSPLTGDTSALESNPRIALVLCDTAFWGRARMSIPTKHQQRQSHNATLAYHTTRTRWLAHIDCDEFIHAPHPVTDALAALSQGTLALQLPPAEEIATENTDTLLFRRTYFDAGVRKSILYDIYPTFGRYLRSGFISHTAGKSIVRTGLDGDLLFGLHQLKINGTEVPAHRSTRLTLLHRHAPDWDSFHRHLRFRLDHGSYRKRDDTQMGLGDILDVLYDEHGPDGARLLFDEVCTARADVIDTLEENNMLIRTQLLTSDSAYQVKEAAGA